MKKIGLLTFHYAKNYGALLQTLSTLEYLRINGKNIKLINLVRQPQNKFISFVYEKVFHFRFNRFTKKYLSIFYTDRYFSNQNISHLADSFDIFLSGSDQIWRTKNTTAFGLKYFLDFAGNSKRISYASSFGVSDWEEQEKKERVKSLMQKFDAVSVREESGVILCKDLFNVNAVKVVDPTLLMPASFYREIAMNCYKRIKKPFMSCFFLDYQDGTNLNIIDSYSKSKKWKLIDLSIPKLKIKNKSLDVFPKPVEEWLYILDNSDFIITESFHCVIFSLLFRKQFVCVKNRKRGTARLESILGRLNLMHLFIEDYQLNKDKLEELYNEKIDYDQVWDLLNEDIEFSKQFLRNNL